MSIIRLSADGPELFATAADGALQRKTYDDAERVGALGTFAQPHTMQELASGPEVPAELDGYISASLAEKAVALRPADPAVVMVHGFLFDPKDAITPDPQDTNNAHRRIYHFKEPDAGTQEKHHTTPWPRMLDMAKAGDGVGGLAIAYGWFSKPGVLEGFSLEELKEWGTTFYSTAYRYAHQTAWPLLACLTAMDRHLAADKPLDVICHSMGSAVTIETLTLAAEHRLPVIGRIGRVIILGGSEYCENARRLHAALLAAGQDLGWTPNQGPVIYNIASREDLVLDALAENFGPLAPWTLRNAVVGHNGLGLFGEAERWIDLQFDSEELQRWMLDNHGIAISGNQPHEATDHWRYFTFAGNWQVYAAILREREAWSLAALRAGTGRDGPVPEGVRLSMAEKATLIFSRLFG